MSGAKPAAVETWHRLHPLSPVVRSARGLGALLVALALLVLSHRGGGGPHSSGSHTDVYVDIAILVMLVTGGVISWLVTRWRVEERHLVVETGLLRRQSKRVPLDRLQAIDLVRPGAARLLGLSELRIRVGGGSGSDARLAYLSEAEADTVRAQLLAISHGVHREAPAPPEQVLFSLRPPLLIASVALETATLVALAVIGILIGVGVALPGSRGTLVGVAPIVLASAAGVWRRLSRSWGFEVASAADGLRLRAGLVSRAAETIPFGRVQAVRLVEPILWRAFGWARLEVDVSGRQHRHREDSDISRQRRILLPVGSAAPTQLLLDLVMPGAPRGGSRPPARARLKAPLSYHFLSGVCDGSYVAGTRGRLRRATTWVPLSKVQSLRLSQGPLQRRLHLADLSADAAGRRSVAVLEDRDAEEAAALLVRVTDEARAARRPPG